MRNREQQKSNLREKIIASFIQCEDRCGDEEIEKQLRHQRREIQEKREITKEEAAEILALLEEIYKRMVQGQLQATDIYIKRISSVIETTAGNVEKRGIFMGILTKVAGVFKRGEITQERLLREQEEETERKNFELEKKIGELSNTHKMLSEELQEKVKKSTSLSPDSPEYQMMKRQAMMIYPKIAAIKKQMDILMNTLEKNSQYHAMILSGRNTIEVKNYLADTTKAEVLMKTMVDETRNFATDSDILGEVVKNYGTDMLGELDRVASSNSRNFEEMVQKEKQKEIQDVSEGIEQSTPEQEREKEE